MPADLRAQSLTILLSGNQVRWTNATGNPLIPGSATNPGSAPVVVTTTWTNLNPGQSKPLAVWAYFNSATAALAHVSGCTIGCFDIPSSAVQISTNGGPSLPVNQTGPFGAAGAALPIFSVRITGQNRTGVQVSTMTFNMNLSTLPNLQVDTYSGTLFIQAQASQ
ncbi:MAG: hypothetical protein L0Z53_13500 [Acidobacteriales bacterium]|nr:hypothetical protein [Terriglobales bacterium]